MKKILVLSFCFLSLVVTAIAQDEVVATVNGQKITKAQLDSYHNDNLKFVGQRKITKEVSLNDLISKSLGIQKAKKTGLDKNAVVLEKMEEVLYHAQISKDLEGELKKITVSDDEVRKYYSDNKEYRTAHILYRLTVNPKPEDVKNALTQSADIYEQVMKNPDSFSTVANKFSQSSAAPVGGDLGFQPPTRLAPEYYEAIKGKKVGYITKPVRTQMGYHVVKVLGVKEYEQIDKNMYKKIIYDQKRDGILDSYFKNLQKGADIKINKQYL
jgi:parvulin-like peptidyl-prolyl isomerase